MIPGLWCGLDFGSAWMPTRLPNLRFRELCVALTLYQIEKGQPPPALDDLVPDYLPALPQHPLSDMTFRYQVSMGEGFRGMFLSERQSRTRQIQQGQGLLWVQHQGLAGIAFVVPMAAKSD